MKSAQLLVEKKEKKKKYKLMKDDIMNAVKCVLNFDQYSYKPGQTVRCFITLTFSEELTYRSKFFDNDFFLFYLKIK